MASKIFLWIEDRKGKSGYTFWEMLMKQVCPQVIVESKKNNSELVKAVKSVSDDEFLVKRAAAIKAREKFVENLQAGEMNYKEIQEVIEYDKNLGNHNVEQLAAKLLFDLTRNTGFEVTKAKIGDCWITSCCDWNERQEDDICGLDQSRLSVADKMKEIYIGTSLEKEFERAEVEVVL